LLQEHRNSIFQLIQDNWNKLGVWPELNSAMRLVLPEPGNEPDLRRDPGRWLVLPGLCCQATGGEIEATLEISAAWLLLYTAAHIVDTIEDGDQDPQVNLLGGTGAAINTANGLFLSAVLLLNSMQKKDIPKDLAAEITADYLETILIMTSGQHRDLIIPQMDLNQWWQVAEAKSGAFFSLACRAGAQLGAGDPLKVKAYSDYGFHLGLMLQIVDDLEDFQILLNSGEIASPRSMERSLAATYAHDVLPDETKDEFIQLTRSDSAQKEMGDKLIGMLDDCGAGLYMLAELEKHFDLGLASLVEAQPAPPTGEKLEAIIRALK
jgi:geranylgeranyl pyrophosphate synthase